MRKNLTELSISNLKPPISGRVQIADGIVTGLWLRVTSNGIKSWSVMYRPQGATQVHRLTSAGGPPCR